MRHPIASRSFAALFALLLSVSALPAFAQSLAGVGYEEYASAPLEGVPSSEVRVSIFHADVVAPVPITKRLLFAPGINYEHLDFGTNSDEQAPLNTLQQISLNLGGVYLFSERWSAQAAVGGGFASDFENGLSSQDVLITASGVVAYRFDSFSLGGGVGYDRRTGTLGVCR